MPNHFHFMIQPKPEGCKSIVLKEKISHLQILSKTIGKTLSSYTQAINIENNTTGNLFQKKTKAKCLTNELIIEPCYTYIDYLLNCFHYIHQNPVKAKIVTNPKYWSFSSWLDYYGLRNGTLCNKQMAMERMGLSHLDFRIIKEFKTDPKIIERIS